MTNPRSTEVPARVREGRGLVIGPVLVAVWWILTEGAVSSWIIGIPLVLVSIAVVRTLPSEGSWRWMPSRILYFLAFFLWQSTLSGIQVAWLALRMRVSLEQHLLYYDVRLPSAPSRVFFANAVSVLPGTLSCIVTEELIVIHVLNRSPAVLPALQTLELRVAELFGLTLREPVAEEESPHA